MAGDTLVLSYFAGNHLQQEPIAAGRDMLDGAEYDSDAGIYNAMTGDYILAPTDGNAVAFSCKPPQVLQIGNAVGTPGGFFPNGFNGNFQ